MSSQDLLKILKIGFLVTQVVSILGHNAGDKCYILFSTLQPKFNEIIQFYMLDLSFFLFFFISLPHFSLFSFPFCFWSTLFFWWVPVYNKLQDFKHGYSKNLFFFSFFFLISNKDVYSKSYLVQKGKRQIKDYRRE